MAESIDQQLATKYVIYVQEGRKIADSEGFISTDHCDSLLWSGLAGTSKDWSVEIDSAYDPEEDLWHRRPLRYPSCYNYSHPDVSDPEKTTKARVKRSLSKIWRILKTNWRTPSQLSPLIGEVLSKEFYYKESSTISRDMLVGLAWYAHENRRLDIAHNIVKRAVENWGWMGLGSISATNIMPGLLGTFMMIEAKFGGKKRWWAKYLPIGVHGRHRGYTAHLEVLHITLRREITGKLSKKEAEALEWYAADQPRNAFFQWAAGKVQEAKILLLDEAIFPKDRLPTNHDRYEEWIFQRSHVAEDGGTHSDWLSRTVKADGSNQPEPLRIHSGADFIFLVNLMSKHGHLSSKLRAGS